MDIRPDENPGASDDSLGQAPADTLHNDSSSVDTTDTQDPAELPYYFPETNDDSWQTVDAAALGWHADSLSTLLDYVSRKNTYGFVILYKGRIVTEQYWNKWDKETKYVIASAGKTITAFLLGIAQTEGKLDVNAKTSEYLGGGWTSAEAQKENMIQLRHQLSMTTGLDEVHDACNEPACLQYKADAGQRWAYHNAAYNFLHPVLTSATGMSLNDYTKSRLADKIGMKNWTWENNILSLTTRDMARFGLLLLQGGSWDGEKILDNSEYFKAMTSSSNNKNKSYGYLTWLNGQDSYMVPGDETVYDGPLVPFAPRDMFAAMGKGDKKIYIVPSLDLVVVRHGDDTGDNTFGPSSFDSELWRRLKGVIGFGR